MSNRSFLRSPRRNAVLIVLLIVPAAFIALGARARRIPKTKAPAPVAAPVTVRPAAAQDERKRDHNMQVERVTVGRHGFERSAIARPTGRFLLAVDNRSGLEEINLQIVRENGNRDREMKVHRKKPDWKGFVDLPPGQYKLIEAGHADWVCRITITAR